MHFARAKGILSSGNGMNLYRGCTHGCIYCDSRSVCYNMDHRFEDIEVKENAIELLEQALKKKRKRCMIGTGSMTDPYVPIEAQLEYVKKSLMLIEKYGFGFTVITKSNLILRDIDILKRINNNTKCVVQMTLTTADDALCKMIEPNVCATSERFEALKRFRDEEIPTVVWLSPILPYINDTEKNINDIIDMCIEAKVKGIICFSMGLTLREGNREYFYEKLDELFPGLKEKYIKDYGYSYGVISKNNDLLMNLFHNRCEENRIMHDNEQIFSYMRTFEEKNADRQISIWDIK